MVALRHAEAAAMTPDESVIWRVEDRPEIGGSMLVAPECPVAVYGALRKVAAARLVDPSVRVGRYIGGGSSGNVYLWPNPRFALRIAGNTIPVLAEFEPLRANVTLAEGLLRTADSRTGSVIYKAPTYHAAYFPYSDKSRGVAIWAMSYEPGMHRAGVPTEQRRMIPRKSSRRAMYHSAIEACGGDIRRYDLDMDDSNELYCMAAGSAALTIVKLDISHAMSIT